MILNTYSHVGMARMLASLRNVDYQALVAVSTLWGVDVGNKAQCH